MLDTTNWLLLVALVGGPLLIGLLIWRGARETSQRRQNDLPGIARTEAATHRLYQEEENRGDPAGRS